MYTAKWSLVWYYNSSESHALNENKCDNVKGSCYEELWQVLNKFSKYHMTILLTSKQNLQAKIFSNWNLETRG
jgi:hypothetical protein